MNIQDKSATNHKIDRKWVREEKRIFSEYPGLPKNDIPGEEENWLELTEFFCEDLQWLLSLEHHKFWSHMIYSEKPHQLLISFLKNYPPCFLKNKLSEKVKKLLNEVERLVFLVFLRLSTEKESESCYLRNFGQVIYNNYLFTVPIILDICLIYGTSNRELVQKMINFIIASAPDFLDDFQEIIPHFICVLKTIEEKFSGDLKVNQAEDLVFYLSDSVATIQIFFGLYPNVCQIFSKSEFIEDVVNFYANTIPEIVDRCKSFSLNLNELIDSARLDLLRIIKTVFDFVLNEASEMVVKKDEFINEYLSLMMLFLSKPVFLLDYNSMFSIEFELRSLVKKYPNLDTLKVNFILDGIEGALTKNETSTENNVTIDSDVKLISLISEVKDIFPHLEENVIKQYLSCYNNDTEKVIAAVLENIVPPEMNNEKPSTVEYTGKHKTKHKNLIEMLDDREEINKMRDRYMELSLVDDGTYDDEYDDTYDENIGVAEKDEVETVRRPFVVPRVLRPKYESEEEDEEEEEEPVEENQKRDMFVQDPAVAREQWQRRYEENRRNVRGRPKGQGQSNQVTRNREFKESHKSSMANHNRKKQAARKMNRGMIPS